MFNNPNDTDILSAAIKRNAISAAISFQKENYPKRTEDYTKCKRDLAFVLDAYNNDLKINYLRCI